MFKSIKWRLISINALLISLGIIISGVFITKSLESFNLSSIDERLVGVAGVIMPKLSEYDSLATNKKSIERSLMSYKDIGLREEIYVIDPDFKVIASSSSVRAEYASDYIDMSFLNDALNGKTINQNTSSGKLNNMLITKNYIIPIVNKSTYDITGAIYIRYDLTDVYDSLDGAKLIILQGALLSIILIIIVGFFIAGTITVPINEVTDKAKQMADGDFDQIIEVKSDDELGKLGEVFNFLTRELKTTLSIVNSEKSKLQAIIRNMDDGLIATDLEGAIIHINPNARKMLSIEDRVETIASTPLKDCFDAENIINSSKRDKFRINIGDRLFKVTSVPYKSDTDIIIGVIFVIQDITEQDKLEAMRKEFVANVSHELKTPLTTIKTYTETVLSGDIEDEAMKSEFLAIVVSEIDRMSRLVRDLLQLSQFDAQRINISQGQSDAVSLVDNVCRKLRAQLRQKNISIDVTTSSPKVILDVDEDKLEQVILNILSNAIKYSFEGRAISLDIAEKIRGEELVLITIKDEGIGMPYEATKRIFDRFYRVDSARSRDHGGTGLGLSIAKEIVELHGGKIWAESSPDKGSTFYIELPKSKVELE